MNEMADVVYPADSTSRFLPVSEMVAPQILDDVGKLYQGQVPGSHVSAADIGQGHQQEECATQHHGYQENTTDENEAKDKEGNDDGSDEEVTPGDLWDQLVRLAHRFESRYHLKGKVAWLWGFTAAHPLVAVFFGFAAITCSVPGVLFLLFVIASIAFMFVAFLMVEGVLLFGGGVLLLGSLTVATMVSAGFSFAIAIGWYAVKTTIETFHSPKGMGNKIQKTMNHFNDINNKKNKR